MHTIYHIPGKKIGCTADFEKRKRRYLKGTEFKVEMELTGYSDQEAGDIEWRMADLYGYPRGVHYKVTAAGRGKGGKVGGKAKNDKTLNARQENIMLARKTQTQEQLLKACSAGGKTSTKIEIICPKCGRLGINPSIYCHIKACRKGE